MEKQYYIISVCVCSLRYPAWKVHVPYCHLMPTWLHNIFPHYLKKVQFSKISYWKHKICFNFLYNFFSETFFFLQRNEWDMIKSVYRSSRKEPTILVWLQWNLNFVNRFSKNTILSNFIKSAQWEPSCSKWTDIIKITVTFSNFANASKKKAPKCFWMGLIYCCLSFTYQQETDVTIQITNYSIMLCIINRMSK